MSLETKVANEDQRRLKSNNNNNNNSNPSSNSSDNNQKQSAHSKDLEHKRLSKNTSKISTQRALTNRKTPCSDQHSQPLKPHPPSSLNNSNRSNLQNHDSGGSSGFSHRQSKSKSERPRPRCGRTKRAATLPSPCHSLVEQIIYTVGQLEHTLIEDHQNDFELRMALERQTEQVRDLRSSLHTEKQRNERLVQLIRGVDSASSTEEDEQYLAGGGVNCINVSRWQSRTSMDAFESISPLLMQQRYDELVLSHKQCRKQLIKKEKLLTHTKCEKEEFQGRYDHVLHEYRNVQQTFEELCCKYLRLQAKKNEEILKLRQALSYASDCVISAQQVMEHHNHDDATIPGDKEFRQNLQLFIKALRLCEWAQNRSNRATAKQC